MVYVYTSCDQSYNIYTIWQNIAAELMLGKVIAVVFLMAAAEEWTSRESDSLPEEGMATAANIVAVEAEKIPSEGRLCSAGEKPDVA